MDGSPKENVVFIYLILFAGQIGIAKRHLKKKKKGKENEQVLRMLIVFNWVDKNSLNEIKYKHKTLIPNTVVWGKKKIRSSWLY